MTHIKTKFQTTASNHGHQRIRESSEKRPAPKPRVPHITKLMALAIRLDHLLAAGQIKDQAEIARTAGITRARVTQILNLLLLAPDIQTQILQLPGESPGHVLTTERDLRTVTQSPNWREQRRLWSEIGG
jgi:hypothetical protein